MNYLIIGVNSMIGSALFNELQRQGLSVYGTTRNVVSNEHHFHLDLLNDASLWNAPDTTFNVIYLCAGITDIMQCEHDSVLTRSINVSAIERIIHHFSKSHHNPFIIYPSSNHVFNGNLPYARIDTSHAPNNQYGSQKSEVERFITTNCNHWAITRMTKVINSTSRLFNHWIDQMHNYQSIDAYQDMTFAPIGLKEVIQSLVTIGTKRETGYFHLSGASDITYYNFAQDLAAHIKRPASLVHSINAIDNGIKKIMIPSFTTLDCSSTMIHCHYVPPTHDELIKHYF